MELHEYASGQEIMPGIFFIKRIPNDSHGLLCQDKYGLINVNTWNHLNRGSSITIKAAINKTEYWINRAKELYPEYDYSKVNYTGNKSKVILGCHIHGEFLKSPADLFKETGCKKCGELLNTGSYGLKRANRHKKEWLNTPGFLYVIKCCNKNESFYKVGITKRKNKSRIKTIPYQIKIIHYIRMNLYTAATIEHKLHQELFKFKHTTMIHFGGHTECYKNLKPINEWLYINT